MLQAAEGAAYLARVSISSPEKVMQAKKSIIKAFECQMEKRGFSYVEFLSPCTTGLRKNPPEAMAWVREEMEKYFPIGVIKSKEN
jgi:2-oxoglutarate ferredoxin oxidoreductase subunit beta